MSFIVASQKPQNQWAISVEQEDSTRVLVKVNGIEIFRFWENGEGKPQVSSIYSAHGLRSLGFEIEGGKVKVL